MFRDAVRNINLELAITQRIHGETEGAPSPWPRTFHALQSTLRQKLFDISRRSHPVIFFNNFTFYLFKQIIDFKCSKICIQIRQDKNRTIKCFFFSNLLMNCSKNQRHRFIPYRTDWAYVQVYERQGLGVPMATCFQI